MGWIKVFLCFYSILFYVFECSFASWNFTCLRLGKKKKRFQVKFFYLTQLAYWLHALPELYFQKVRKVSAANRPAPSYARARSARDQAESCSLCCFSGGAFPSAAVHLSVSAARRRTLFIKVSVQDIKHLQTHELPEGALTFVLVSVAAWAGSVWCFSFSSTCQSWDSTLPDSFTSLMRITRKCKWPYGSFLGFIGEAFLTLVCFSGLTCGQSALYLHGWLHWPWCSWQWDLVWLVQRTRDWTLRRATLTQC